MDKGCKHEFKYLDTAFTSRECGYRRFKYKRVDRFYCIKCLKEEEKIKEQESSFEKPEWYFGS